MTIDEYMHAQKPNQVVAIGAGTGFIFIGTVKEYEEKIDKEYKKHVDYAKDLLRRGQNMLEACERDGVPDIEVTIYDGDYEDPLSMVETANNWLHESAKIKDYARLLNAYATKVGTAAKQQLRAEAMLKAIPYRLRDVKETYPSVTEDKIIAIVEGDESGRYWDYKEVKREDKNHGTKKDPGNYGES